MKIEVNVIKQIEVCNEDNYKATIRLIEDNGDYIVTIKKEYKTVSPMMFASYYETREQAEKQIAFFMTLAE